jgi:citrate lyase beta subunit
VIAPTPLQLGASLYVPATRPDLVAIATGIQIPEARSIILCTEDSILADQMEAALANLRALLPSLRPNGPPIFIRPRTPNVLRRLLEIPGIEGCRGFVLPKITPSSLRAFMRFLPPESAFAVMPILETREVFVPAEMAALRRELLTTGIRERVLALRIGGNDLLSLLGIRRRAGGTIYDTALGPVIASLVTTFLPDGFSLTAPVFDNFADEVALREEVRRDLAHGLIGKSAIHPSQLRIIEEEYRVSEADLEIAHRILADDALPVFRCAQVMCEPATHANWARITVQRARIYGTVGPERGDPKIPFALSLSKGGGRVADGGRAAPGEKSR